jgi:hypothetical protein
MSAHSLFARLFYCPIQSGRETAQTVRLKAGQGEIMPEAAEEMTPEKEAEFRKEVIAELAAEESGEPIVAPAEKPAEKEPEVEVKKEVELEPEDPWAGVNPALKTQFDEMSTRVSGLDTAEKRIKQLESRIGGITNDLHNAKAATIEAAKKVKEAPTEAQLKEAAESEEKWNELKEDYPDWAIAFDGRLDSRLASFEKKMTPGVDQETLKAELETLKTTMKTENAAGIEKAVLTFAHPDWEAKIASDTYKTWVKDQPGDVVAKTQSARAVDAISVLDGFAESQKKPAKTAEQIAKERQDRLDASVLIPGRKTTPPKSEADMTEAELRSSIAREVFADN